MNSLTRSESHASDCNYLVAFLRSQILVQRSNCKRFYVLFCLASPGLCMGPRRKLLKVRPAEDVFPLLDLPLHCISLIAGKLSRDDHLALFRTCHAARVVILQVMKTVIWTLRTSGWSSLTAVRLLNVPQGAPCFGALRLTLPQEMSAVVLERILHRVISHVSVRSYCLAQLDLLTSTVHDLRCELSRSR
jgi:hypothetical protein